MNIFFLDKNCVSAAHTLADIHVGSKNRGGKMIVESTQMLTNCYSLDQLLYAPKTKNGLVRKHSYYNHRCSKWVRNSIDNFEWLLGHALAMVQEKMYRGGNHHFCDTFLQWAKENVPNLPQNGFTKPALAMPDEYKNDDPVIAYRKYYNEYKRNTIDMQWTRRKPPAWWKH